MAEKELHFPYHPFLLSLFFCLEGRGGEVVRSELWAWKRRKKKRKLNYTAFQGAKLRENATTIWRFKVRREGKQWEEETRG
jgi:hypothetical protein